MNKRPLPYVLAGFVLGEVWMWQFHGTAARAALCLAAIICIIIGSLKKGSFFILLSIGILIGGFREEQWNNSKIFVEKYIDQSDHMIQGQIKEMDTKDYSHSVIIENILIEGKSMEGNLQVYLEDEPECKIGSRILLKGRIEEFALPTNPGGFHQKAYQDGKGVFGLIRNPEIIEVRMGSFLIKDGINEIRKNSSNYMKNYMKEDCYGIGIAMALGNKSYLEEEQKNLYEFAGISHVLAVSGLHMSLLGAAIYKILRKWGFGYTISVFSAIPCILVYAVMTGMSSSCLRAAIMLIIYLFAEIKGYYYDLPSALSLAGLWLLFEIPGRLFDSGFLLSFGAMISVGIVAPFLFHIFGYKTGIHKIRDSFYSGLMITMFTLPLSLYFFYGFSLAGIVLNLIVIPLMTILLPLLFIGSLGWMPFVPHIITNLCFKAAEFMLEFYRILCRFTQHFPGLYIQAGHRNLQFAVLYYFIWIIGITILYCCFKKKKRWCVMFLPLLVCFVILYIASTGRNDRFMTMLDVGQGDGILYHSVKDEICMIDGGSTSEKKIGQYVLKPAFEYYGIDKIDYWFLTHMDEDHISGAKELLESGYPIRNLILPVRKEISEKQREIEELAVENNTNIFYMKQGDKLRLKEGVIYCLNPTENSKMEDENQNSLVLLLDLPNQQILLTGDSEKEGETRTVQYLKNFKLDDAKEQILKVGHHGSSNGTKESLLKVFKPDVALISCALKNRYGHPATETINRIGNVDADIYYTMKHGAIEIRLGKETSYFGYGMVK